MAINISPSFNFEFATYEQAPKTPCLLCNECFEPSHLITVPNEKNICIKCAEILGDIASERRGEIKKQVIEDMLSVFSGNAATGTTAAIHALYDAGYRKTE